MAALTTMTRADAAQAGQQQPVFFFNGECALPMPAWDAPDAPAQISPAFRRAERVVGWICALAVLGAATWAVLA